jgi:polysaccharide biosynthesis protein PslJ
VSTAERWDRLARADAVGFLTLFICALIFIPSRLIIAQLGGAGTPAELIGMGLGVWWLAVRLGSPRQDRRLRQPVRTAMFVLTVAVLLSYVAAAARPIAAVEQRAADNGVLIFLAWLGLLLAATDAIPTRERLDALLRRLVGCSAALASLGLLQFVTKQPFTNYIQIPGLTANSDVLSVFGREGLTRPAGTALHPIEFGAVLTMVLPIALHYALSDHGRGMMRRWYPVVAIVLAVPISISRSAILSTIVVLLFFLPALPRRIRRRFYLCAVPLGGFLFVVAPGLLGTLAGLFTGIGTESSAQSRTGSYTLAAQFISRAPFFGRGFQTFLPSYRILDNQYLGVLIDMGLVGLISLLALFVTGIVTASRIRRSTKDPTTRLLAQVLAASVASATASFALFDAFSFPMAACLIFLLLGCVGCLRRVVLLDDASLADHTDAIRAVGASGRLNTGHKAPCARLDVPIGAL